MMFNKFEPGDVLVYVNDQWPAGHGSLALFKRHCYRQAYVDVIEISWISVHPTLAHRDNIYGAQCFEKVGHVEPT